MPINADKPLHWKDDIQASVDQFNQWFMVFAPKAFREARLKTTKDVETSLQLTKDLTAIDAATIAANPQILPTLRMATCPPLARDRLVGLAYTTKHLVYRMEEGAVPSKLAPTILQEHLGRISDIISKMLDRDIFPWLASKTKPTKAERHRASTVVADRLCTRNSDAIFRSAELQRQLGTLDAYLTRKGYQMHYAPESLPLAELEPGTYALGRQFPVFDRANCVTVVADAVIQPKRPGRRRLPIRVTIKSADTANKRQRYDLAKARLVRATYGGGIDYILLLCGKFDGGYLGRTAAEGVDWVWEHRIEDLRELGI